MLSKEDLVQTCVDICYYAQEHSKDWDRVEQRIDLDYAMEHVSYVIACFIAQNTKGGQNGVDWDVVHKHLYGPVLTYQQWRDVITQAVESYQE